MVGLGPEKTVFNERELAVLSLDDGTKSAKQIASALEIDSNGVRQARYTARQKMLKIDWSLEVIEKVELQPVVPIEFTPEKETTDSDWGGLDWSKWYPLTEVAESEIGNGGTLNQWTEEDTIHEYAEGEEIESGGLIRLRHWSKGLVYVGHTTNLKERLHAINNQMGKDEIPDTAPVSAAPELWELINDKGGELEVSIATLPEYPPKFLSAMQVALITMARQHAGESPLTAFGGDERSYAPLDWANYEKTEADGWPASVDWLGLEWSNWSPLSTRLDDPRPVSGNRIVYMIRSPTGAMVRIGSSKNPTDRLRNHERNYGEQYEYTFAEPDVTNDHHLWETEADIIGAYVFAENAPPLDFNRL